MRSPAAGVLYAALLVLTAALAAAVAVPGAKALAPPGTCIPAQGCFPPSTPAGFKISSTTQTSATLRWTTDNTQESFDIQRRPPGGTWVTVSRAGRRGQA